MDGTVRVIVWNELEDRGIFYLQGRKRSVSEGRLRSSEHDIPSLNFDGTTEKASSENAIPCWERHANGLI